LTVGKWILAHAQVPFAEHWNMFALSKPWVAYSWSNEVLFAWFDGVFGAHGLLVLKILLGVGITFSFAYCYSRICEDWFIGLLIGALVTAGCYGHFTLRPQSLVWCYFIWALYWADQIRSEGLTRKSSLFLVLIFCAWANAHITTAIGLFAVTLWVYDREELPRTVLVALLCLMGTFLTPYLGAEWLVFLGKSNHPFQHASIMEFQPANILQYPTGVLLFLSIWVLVFLIRRPFAVAYSQLVVVGVMFFGALVVVKFIPFAVIVLGLLLADMWRSSGTYRNAFGNLGEAVERLRTFTARIPREGLTFVFLCSAIVSVVKVWREPIDTAVTPVHAVDFFLKEQLPHPVLNDFGKGGYLMYRLSNDDGTLDYPVAIDGRTNVTPHEIWEKFSKTFHGQYGWSEFIDAVDPQTILWRAESPTSNILLNNTDWCLIYRSGSNEEGYLLFVKHAFYEANREKYKSENCDVPSETSLDVS
ncbi:MAG: hypothetical protein KDD55_09410, partial [Bdellovibrionales bacterium]|nr:hypothetical protein [Bdellovibrionales bacterium]